MSNMAVYDPDTRTWKPVTEAMLSGGSAVTPPGGGSATLPYTITLTDGAAQVVGVAGVKLPLSIRGNVESGDTVRVRYRFSATDEWSTLGSFTADFFDALETPAEGLEIQRTGGSGTTSYVVIA